MPTRNWMLVALSAALLTACDTPGSEDPGDGEGTTGDPDGPTTTANDDANDDANSESDGDSDSDGDGGTGTDTNTGTDTGDMSGYPDDVLDHLDLPWPPYDYDPELPAHFETAAVQALDNTPADNPIRDPGATLGRVLFYDVALSANETISCASCHPQSTGFSDTLTLSEGFDGGLTGRNSMGLANARFYAAGHFFWDERADTLEDQVLMPIQDPVEMGLTLEQLVQRVQQQPYYPALFAQAFGDETVDADRISRALAQFVRAMVSYRAPWDEGIAQVNDPTDDFPNYTAQQNLGKAVFFGPGRCAVCHLEQDGPPPPPGQPLPNRAIFMLTEAANNGLDAALDNADNGVGDVVGDPGLNGVFKSPSLRNVALTAPYMHDGRFDTLAQVVEHYDSGVQPHPNLDPRLRMPGPGGQPQRLNLSDPEKAALVEFMHTLTDDALAQDERFADPFR
ncbi:MAG: cytochrome c peroxidase [Myxococcota bacterium]